MAQKKKKEERTAQEQEQIDIQTIERSIQALVKVKDNEDVILKTIAQMNPVKLQGQVKALSIFAEIFKKESGKSKAAAKKAIEDQMAALQEKLKELDN